MAPARMFLGFAVLGVMRGIDFEDETNLNLLRAAFVVVQVSLIVAMGVMYAKIKAAGDKTEIAVPVKLNKFAPPEEQDADKTEVMTVEEYDLQQLKGLATKVLMACTISGAIHWKWALVPPLFMQCVLNPVQLLEHALAKIYFFGQAATHELARPWKEDKPFDMMSKFNEADPNKIRQEEKKAARAAKKEKEEAKKSK